MNRYEPPTSRAACGVTAIAMAAITFALMVGLPAAAIPGVEAVYAGAPDSVAPAMRSATTVPTSTVANCTRSDSPSARNGNRSRELQV